MQRNWLDVYPYTNWGGNGTLPVFVEGQEFVPASIDLKEVCACAMGPLRGGCSTLCAMGPLCGGCSTLCTMVLLRGGCSTGPTSCHLGLACIQWV